jgi:hypothetical protein
MNYNLLEEPWIPVLMRNGEYRPVGIKDALTQAGRIRQIAATNPMDRVAVLRFLLALLYWCKGNPPEGARAGLGDSFPSDWFRKLDERKDCFNLLGERHRFYQYKKSDDKRLTANYLIHEVPTGTNIRHFRHSTDKVDGLCPGCCALGLLRLPLFATSGGQGKSPGVNAKPPLYVVPVGASLAATLSLSWRPVTNLGIGAWERPDLLLPKEGEVPVLTGLTWLPRRVWLDDPGEPVADCVSCGRNERLVRLSVFAGVGSTKTAEGGRGRIWRDPHVLCEISSKGQITSLHASNALGSSDAAAGQWARITRAILESNLLSTETSTVWIVGFSTVQNDKCLEAMERRVRFPMRPSEVQQSIETIERWQREGPALARKIRPRSDKKSSRKHVEIPPMLAAIRPHVENRVCAKAGQLLTGGESAWNMAAREYRPMMNVIARSLSPGFTTAAVRRRQEIAWVLPRIGPQTESAKKRSPKKGGDK